MPWDVVDGTFQAYWRRPAAYLNPDVRTNISIFRLLEPMALQQALDRLDHDLRSGAWQARNSQLLHLDELDVGNRLITIERTDRGRAEALRSELGLLLDKPKPLPSLLQPASGDIREHWLRLMRPRFGGWLP